MKWVREFFLSMFADGFLDADTSQELCNDTRNFLGYFLVKQFDDERLHKKLLRWEKEDGVPNFTGRPSAQSIGEAMHESSHVVYAMLCAIVSVGGVDVDDMAYREALALARVSVQERGCIHELAAMLPERDMVEREIRRDMARTGSRVETPREREVAELRGQLELRQTLLDAVAAGRFGTLSAADCDAHLTKMQSEICEITAKLAVKARECEEAAAADEVEYGMNGRWRVVQVDMEAGRALLRKYDADADSAEEQEANVTFLPATMAVLRAGPIMTANLTRFKSGIWRVTGHMGYVWPTWYAD